MNIAINDEGFLRLATLFEMHGYESRLVGGAVRDTVAGLEPKDTDVATPALPDVVIEIAQKAGLRVIETGLKHGTVTVVIEGVPYEVTTLRRDVSTDGRHAIVEYVDDFKLDASRRDFTFNAMSATPDGVVHDYFGGVDDLSKGIVRFVGDARTRIEEDYLRILRFFRFRCRFGGSETDNELAPIRDAARGLGTISAERIWSEVSRILSHPNCSEQLYLMDDLGVAAVIELPCEFDQVEALDAARKSGASAATLLGMLCSSDAAAADLPAKWRLSTREQKEAATAIDVWNDHALNTHHWLCRAVDGLDHSAASPVLMATGRHDSSLALAGAIPEFPLRGRDLVDFCPPGKAMGALLQEAKEDWKASGFALTLDDLKASASEKVGVARAIKP